ncbi:MAG: hypothetical protein AAGI07_12140 [Bacteroidota bacterium]
MHPTLPKERAQVENTIMFALAWNLSYKLEIRGTLKEKLFNTSVDVMLAAEPGYEKSWKEIDRLIMKRFKNIVDTTGIITSEPNEAKGFVFWISDEFITNFLLKEKVSQKTANRIHFYLSILQNLGERKVPVFALALVRVKPFIDSDRLYYVKRIHTGKRQRI